MDSQMNHNISLSASASASLSSSSAHQDEEIEIMSSLSSSSSVLGSSNKNNNYSSHSSGSGGSSNNNIKQPQTTESKVENVDNLDNNIQSPPKKNTINNSYQSLSPMMKRTRPFQLPSLPTIPSGGAISVDSSDQEQQPNTVRRLKNYQSINNDEDDGDEIFTERNTATTLNGNGDTVGNQGNNQIIHHQEEEEKKEYYHHKSLPSHPLHLPPERMLQQQPMKTKLLPPKVPLSSSMNNSNNNFNNNNKTNKKKKKNNKKKIDLMQSRRRRKLATIESDSCSTFLTTIKSQQQQEKNGNGENLQHEHELEDDHDIEHNGSKIILPLRNQYECILRRRAIVKEEDKEKHLNLHRSILTKSSSSSLSPTAITNTKRRSLFSTTIYPIQSNTTTLSNNNSSSSINDTNKDNNSKQEDEVEEEIYGDTTLGMKLTILSGKVIVQNIIPLNDGRASPAQLSGYIKKGDVIISINDQSLSFLQFENVSILVDRLAPLSNPNSTDGVVYDREVKIRFEIGGGFKLLEKDSKKVKMGNKAATNADVNNQDSTPTKVDGASDLFNLSKFTFVDQLSGKPLFFDEEQFNPPPKKEPDKEPESPVAAIDINTASTPKLKNEAKANRLPILPRQPLLTLPKRKSGMPHSAYKSQHQALETRLSNIGYACSLERVIDFVKYSNSGYFLLNPHCSSILNQQPNFYEMICGNKNGNVVDGKSELSPKEMVSFGKKVLVGVNHLIDQVEYSTKRKKPFDPLKVVHDECKSFSSRSRFSQHSKMNQRRNFLLQVPSLTETQHDKEDDETSTSSDPNELNESDSLGSDVLGENNDIGGDEMLLRLAAWNKSWKQQMVETLDAASVHREKSDENKKKAIKKFDGNNLNKADTLELQLQNLFFGEQFVVAMSEKKPSTLPPEEMTEVIYALALSVNTTVPLNVNIMSELDLTNVPVSQHDENISPRLSSSKKNTEILEGTRFLLDDIIPLWLDTFRPLQIQQRRVLWPLNKEGSSSIGTPDDLSACSSTSGWSARSPDRRDNLEKRVASIELDPDTRAETCYLVTFYFKRKVLSQFQSCNMKDCKTLTSIETTVIEFIDKFGCYLNLYDSLIAATDSFSTTVLQKLITLASYDPTHNEYVKLFSKDGIFVPYETKLFSCLLARLTLFERKGKGRANIFAMIVAAYPDLKPWQIRSMMLQFDCEGGEILNTKAVINGGQDDVVFYYEYLSLLMESSQMARLDKSLVKEWCFLSTSSHFTWENQKRKENFINVAEKPKTEDCIVYVRDLPFLIETCYTIKEYSLALNLAVEIVSTFKSSSDDYVIEKVLTIIRLISKNCLDDITADDNSMFDIVRIRQILSVLYQISTSSVGDINEVFDTSKELGVILDYCKDVENAVVKEEALITLIAETMSSTDTLKTLSGRSLDHISSRTVVSALRICFEKGATDEESALMRLRKMRPSVKVRKKESTAPFIWENLVQNSK